MQLIYSGETFQSLSKFKFPNSFLLSSVKKNFIKALIRIKLLDEITNLYVTSKRTSGLASVLSLGARLKKVSREETFRKCHKILQNITIYFPRLESFPNLLNWQSMVQPKCFWGGNTFRVVHWEDCHDLKWGSHLPKKKNFICFNDSRTKMMKIAFYLILKALFVVKIFKFLSWLFGHVEKMAWLRKIRLISKIMTSQPG